MAGTVTITEIVTGSIKRITFDWTSSAGGAADGTTTALYTGDVIYAAFIPGTGANQPSDLYDVTLVDSGAVDVLAGDGANLSNAANVYLDDADGLTSVTASALTLAVTNAGASNTGQVVIFIIGTWNAYCSLEQIKNRLNPLGVTTSVIDDAVIDEMIEQASRAIDAFCGGRTFYARTETHYFDVPEDRALDVDDDLLSVTTLTHGDATVLTSSDYILLPYNQAPYYQVRLKETTGYVWTVDTSGNAERAISLAGSWGYVDRTATDARSARVIRLTENMAIDIVMAEYKRRYGDNATGTAIVTAGGGGGVAPGGSPPRQKKKN